MATLIEAVDPVQQETPAQPSLGRRGQLVQWVMGYTTKWRTHRDTSWQEVWGEWYRLYRGRHIDKDKNYQSERSKLVAPALAQALEMTVAELEEASFGREQWIDIIAADGSPDHKDVTGMRRRVIEDLQADKVPSAVAQCFLNGGLFGTLAGKVAVERKTTRKIVDVKDPDTNTTRRVVQEEPGVSVRLIPIPVTELIPDPDAEHVDEMLAIVHECRKTPAYLSRFSWGKAYAKKAPGNRLTEADYRPEFADKEDIGITDRTNVLLTEWHGLVPKYLLNEGPEKAAEDDPLAGALISNEPVREPEDTDELVEAIVTIADGSTLLRAMENPFYMKDRSIVATAFEKVPGKFWGRGVMEKGHNPQRALDAELRARMDAMALISNPMLAVDQTSLPRGFDLTVRPGKVWLSQGKPPKDAFMPFQFPGLDPATFNQTAEMERMVQMGTGAMDTATPLAENRRNETSGGMSMIAGTFVKRAKRALRHVTSDFIEPVVQKIVWRRMQFDSNRYPATLDFRIVSTLGIVARELEQALLTNLLSVLPEGSKAQLVATKAIFDNTSSPYKAEMVAAIDEMMQPDPEAQRKQQQMQDLQMAAAVGQVNLMLEDINKRRSETMLNMAKVQTELAKPGVDVEKLKIEYARLEKEYQEAEAYSVQSRASLIKAMADAINGGKKNEGSQ